MIFNFGFILSLLKLKWLSHFLDFWVAICHFYGRSNQVTSYICSTHFPWLLLSMVCRCECLYIIRLFYIYIYIYIYIKKKKHKINGLAKPKKWSFICDLVDKLQISSISIYKLSLQNAMTGWGYNIFWQNSLTFQTTFISISMYKRWIVTTSLIWLIKRFHTIFLLYNQTFF